MGERDEEALVPRQLHRHHLRHFETDRAKLHWGEQGADKALLFGRPKVDSGRHRYSCQGHVRVVLLAQGRCQQWWVFTTIIYS